MWGHGTFSRDHRKDHSECSVLLLPGHHDVNVLVLPTLPQELKPLKLEQKRPFLLKTTLRGYLKDDIQGPHCNPSTPVSQGMLHATSNLTLYQTEALCRASSDREQRLKRNKYQARGRVETRENGQT